MNKNISILLSLILLFLVSYYLFWKSERDFEKASANFYVLAFENTDLNCKQNALEFFIKNNLLEEKKFQASIKANGETFKDLTISVSAQSQENIIFSPEETALICQKTKPVKFSITTRLEKRTQEIYKLIK